MKQCTTGAMGNPPLSLYPGMRFEAGWDGLGWMPVNQEIPPPSRWADEARPLVRGWIVLSRDMVPGPAEDLPVWVLPWPCRLADLEAKLGAVQTSEDLARQEWLDEGVDAGGLPAALALERQARVVAWLLDIKSAHDLGWQGRSDCSEGFADKAVHDIGLERLSTAMARLVPGAAFRIEGGAERRVRAARSIVADLLALERTGRTHGRCLASMRGAVLGELGLPLRSTSAGHSRGAL